MNLRERYEQRAAAAAPTFEVPPASEVPGREDYGWIDFTGLQNTRDLGGLPAADGRRIKRGLLLRSGSPGFGTQADLERLRTEYDLRLVVDFRSGFELSELPDPMDRLPGARYVHAAIIDEQALGITQDEESRARERERAQAEPGYAEQHLAELYGIFIMNPVGVAGYARFLRELLACERGAALWHCFVGRDRCGIGSALVQTALGVPEPEQERDYLATNVYAPAEFAPGGFGATRAAIRGAVDAASSEYGSLMGYIQGALGITPGELADLRARYLEP